MSEVEDYINQLQNENANLQAQNNELRGVQSNQYAPQDKNLVEYQLDNSELIEKIEHYLKGEVISFDEETGESFWKVPEDKDLIVFNEFGVSTIMLIIQQYITKETRLSNYKEERINAILFDLGNELRKYIYNNYEKMGLTTEFKKSKYPIIVITLLHMIESAYRSSIDALTLKESNTGRVINQSEGQRLGGMGVMPRQQRRGIFSFFGLGR